MTSWFVHICTRMIVKCAFAHAKTNRLRPFTLVSCMSYMNSTKWQTISHSFMHDIVLFALCFYICVCCCFCFFSCHHHNNSTNTSAGVLISTKYVIGNASMQTTAECFCCCCCYCHVYMYVQSPLIIVQMRLVAFAWMQSMIRILLHTACICYCNSHPDTIGIYAVLLLLLLLSCTQMIAIWNWIRFLVQIQVSQMKINHFKQFHCDCAVCRLWPATNREWSKI